MIAGSGRSPAEGIGYPLQYSWASLVAQLIKNPPVMLETWVWKIWRRERLPTPVFWPREFHGLYSPWGHKELDTTEQISLHFVPAAAAASVVSDSVRPQRRQPTRLPRPWDSPGKNTGVGCHFLLQ